LYLYIEGMDVKDLQITNICRFWSTSRAIC